MTIKERIFLGLTTIYLVVTETWIFKATTTLGHVEFVIELLSPVFLLLLFKSYKPHPKTWIIFILYGLFSFYFLTVSLFSIDPVTETIQAMRYIYFLIFPLVLLGAMHPKNMSLNFIKILPIVGVIFSIQTIILFILIYSGNAPPYTEFTLDGYVDLPVRMYGIFGYAHGMNAIGSDLQLYRAQSLFGEPTVFASFGNVSMLMSYGVYRAYGNRKYLLFSIVCFVAVFLAFSMIAYITWFLILAIHIMIKTIKRSAIGGTVLTLYMVPVSALLILFYLSVAVGNDYYSTTPLSMGLSHSQTELDVRIGFVVNSFQLFLDHPFGVGAVDYLNTAAYDDYGPVEGRIAPLVWLVRTGLVGFLIQISILAVFLRSFVWPHMDRSNPIFYYTGLAFIILSLHQSVAGDWFTPLFFFLMVTLISLDVHRFPQK